MLGQVRALDIDKPETCLLLFKSNRDTGAFVAAALLIATFFG
jgi:4-hydroxybenzoate polyprenyltransferase